MAVSVATGLLKISSDFFSKKTQKNPDFPEKYPETQTRPKKPKSSGKNPAVVTLMAAAMR